MDNPLIKIVKTNAEYLAFDCRTFSIVKTDKLAATLLLSMHMEAGKQKLYLSQKFSKKDIRRGKEEIDYLFNSGVFSKNDFKCPSTPTFKKLVVLLTEGCNLACKYCFESSLKNRYAKPKNMTRAVADRCIDYLFKHSTTRDVYLNMYGGEPFLNLKTLKYLVETGNKTSIEKGRRIHYYVTTNGTLISDTTARYLRENNITIQVSLDGLEHSHNANRVFKDGGGSYRVVRKNMDILKKHKIKMNILSVITKSFGSSLKWYKELLNLYGNAEYCFVATKNKNISPSAANSSALLKKYNIYLNNELNKSGTCSLRARCLQKISHRILCGHRLFYGCGGGLEELTVSPAGEIYLCERMDAASGYTIYDDISPDQLRFRYIKTVSEKRCIGCWAKYLCGGGCAHSKNINKANGLAVHFDCIKKKVEITNAIKETYNQLTKRRCL